MSTNLSKLLFSGTLIMGTMITITSKSWVLMWIGLEMNLLSFIPMMNSNKNPYENEAAMKYFITQAMASMILLLSVMMSSMFEVNNMMINILLMSSLFTKMGAAPFHLWFPMVMQGLTWSNAFILMTWQKIAPMLMLSYQILNSFSTMCIVIMSVLIGAGGGFNQTSLRKIMAYSSIGHLGWLIMAMLMGIKYWFIYFIVYTMLNIAVIIILKMNSLYHLPQVFLLKTKSSVKMILFMSMLSLGGMPPFLGFLPKWMMIQNITNNENFIMIMIMVMVTMITLFYYLRMMYSAFTFHSQTVLWENSNKTLAMVILSMAISIAGIPLLCYINLY
uniref:NADH-ubiquinone oxidoreductase chain 2 n=1 Tax=Platycnemis foliacea TaxID=1041950 RepID=A0A0F7J3G0_9ODON|nr:NADH dehydrogenase subunit 2 [Platycnemis foliacea]AKH04363.1 NADH dehydrogenase subunit 2 [Platycnemis foliacea]